MSREPDEQRIVAALAESMLSKLRKNAGKTHWRHENQAYLLRRLREEVEELASALAGDGEDVVLECADVANIAAMIADNERSRIAALAKWAAVDLEPKR